MKTNDAPLGERSSDQRVSPALIVIPCLNEEAHIRATLESLMPQALQLGARIVVADGGSTDGTRRIVADEQSRNPVVTLIDNPQRIQSAAVNRAVALYGEETEYLIRIDAHAVYPPDYCATLIEEAERSGADSVVVTMKTLGSGLFQQATAAAQNSLLGNGGSRHRKESSAGWTDHGHHALMRIAAFRAVGGYDETFSHNEDAELDFRLNEAGYRIWLTDRTAMSYFPRDTAAGLFRQYVSYGRGRARNVVKHRIVPKLRQMLPLMITPILIGALLAVFNWIALLPALLWALLCIGYGAAIAVRQRKPYGPLIGFSAMIMHVGWSLGFWLQLLAPGKIGRKTA